MKLEGKKVLVTGASIRIGRAICVSLAEAGCEIAVHYNNSVDDARALVDILAGMHTKAFSVQADLTLRGACERLILATREQMGEIDILVNNASVFHKQSLAAATPDAVMSEMLVNAFCPIELMRIFARESKANDSGWPEASIVNILDRRVAGCEKGAFPYCLSKNALHDATKMAARELGPAISVNAVAPGPILPPPGKGEGYLEEKAGPMVLAKRPSPKDVANAVTFLLRAEGVTGQVVFVDSGQHLL